MMPSAFKGVFIQSFFESNCYSSTISKWTIAFTDMWSKVKKKFKPSELSFSFCLLLTYFVQSQEYSFTVKIRLRKTEGPSTNWEEKYSH